MKGGPWTDEKLRALANYLEKWTDVLKSKPSADRPFKRIYLDAFCGSGDREMSSGPTFFDDDVASFAETSTNVALSIVPAFDSYVFIDAKRSNIERLQRKISSSPIFSRCNFRVGDANEELTAFCKQTDWRSSRAVAFLDPFGLQVEWKTLSALAATKAVDVWYLFPSGLGISRMTPNSGFMPETWEKRLTMIWGDESWRAVAYQSSKQSNLPLDDLDRQELVKVARPEDFEKGFLARLGSMFPGVANNALQLRNRQGALMYSLVFACSNPSSRALGPALRIAEHLTRPRK